MKKLRLWACALLLVSPLFLPVRVTTAQLKATLEGHTDAVWSVAFSPDGKMLASGSRDKTVRLWAVEIEQLLHILTDHTDEVMSVAFSLDGETLASGSWDGTIRLWNPNTGKLKRTLTDHKGGVGSVVFSSDEKTLASGSADQTILLWNTTTWQVERTLTGHTHVVDVLAFSLDGTMLASGSRDKTIRLWNPHTGKHIRTLTTTSTVNSLAFSPDGKTLASGSWDNTVRLWNPNTGKLKRTLPNQGGWVNPVAFSPDGKTLAIGNRGIALWDTETEEYKRPLISDIGDAVSVVFSRDGQTIASGSADNLVRLLESTPPEVPLPPEVPFANVPFDINNIPEPVPPPQAVRDFFGFSPFYQQWVSVEGFPVLSSEKVNPYALKEAAWLIWHMTRHRPDLLQVFAQSRVRFSITAHNEVTSDIPELTEYLVPHFFWNVRKRGGTCPFTCGIKSTSEERLLGSYTTAPLIHGFTHALHLALKRVDSEFDNRLRTTYNAAMEKGLWIGTYAASNIYEYLAEGAGSWFHAASSSNPIKTRDALKAYDPSLALLIAEIFGDYAWRYMPLAMRTDLPHLQGFDPQSAPRIELPPGTREAYEELHNPAINERNEWINLRPYDPSLIPILNESRTSGDRTSILFMSLSGAEVLLYRVHPDGTETLDYRFPPDPRLITYFSIEVGGLLLAKDSAGLPLAVFQAVEKVGRALVAPELNLITPGLSKVSGDNQSGVSGAVLATPFVVEVRDENLSTLEGISVTFTVIAGDGTLNVTRTTTDENGRAESTLTLGPNLGTNTVLVSAAGIAQPVIFTAVAEPAVAIPDANLRAAVETALRVVSGTPIVSSEMETLPRLEADNANINNLTGLEHATNLTGLWLGDKEVEGKGWVNSNSIKDLSPLAGLTNMTWLDLSQNNIADLSPLAGLTNLTWLDIGGNNLSNISPVSGLINLTALRLWRNNIKDISPVTDLTHLTELNLNHNNITDTSAVAGLTNLTRLRLRDNNISDISPLVANTGLGAGDEVDVRGNPLSYLSIRTHIPILRGRGVTVESDNRAHPALLKISGDNQTGASFASLPQPFVVEAQDANGSALTGVSVTFAVTAGGGTLSTTITRTDENGRAQSTLILGPNLGANTVQVSVTGIRGLTTFHAIADTELSPLTADVNSDGLVNILDLILIASSLGQFGQNEADVNGDKVVNILDLILAAGMFEEPAAAPSAQPQVLETLTAVDVQRWLIDAKALEVRDPIMKRGFVVLEQLLAVLTPTETTLLPNYPNPFNPETWIPYRLAEDTFVTLTIYDGSGRVVRTLDVGHRIASAYESRSKAIYWDGRNNLGEQVASGVYFYTLTAGDFSATRKMLILK